MSTHRPLSSSFLGLPYRILNRNHKKELLRGPWVGRQSRPGIATFRLRELALACVRLEGLDSERKLFAEVRDSGSRLPLQTFFGVRSFEVSVRKAVGL